VQVNRKKEKRENKNRKKLKNIYVIYGTFIYTKVRSVEEVIRMARRRKERISTANATKKDW